MFDPSFIMFAFMHKKYAATLRLFSHAVLQVHTAVQNPYDFYFVIRDHVVEYDVPARDKAIQALDRLVGKPEFSHSASEPSGIANALLGRNQPPFRCPVPPV